MKPLGGQPPQQEIDINDTETVVCDECGNATFIQRFFLRRISPIVSPTGQEAMVPIQVYSLYNSFGSKLYFCNSFTKSIHSGFMDKNLFTI